MTDNEIKSYCDEIERYLRVRLGDPTIHVDRVRRHGNTVKVWAHRPVDARLIEMTLDLSREPKS